MPLVSQATAGELVRVLAYPKFHLDEVEREELLADYLPYCEPVEVPNPAPDIPSCRDPFDVMFLHLARSGKADALVTGDSDLLAITPEFPCRIMTVADFMAELGIA